MSVPLTHKALWREQCYINGQWQGADTSIAVQNPANDAVLGRVPALSADAVTAAVQAASKAFIAWRQLPALKRSAYLMAWHDLMLEHRDDLAHIMTAEQGKPLAEARGEVDYAASYIKWFAEEAPRAYGETIPAAKAGQQIVVMPEPVGVCAAITPWNFPLAMITRKAAAALAAGCTLLIKPSALTPFSALALAQLADEAQIPAGVINVVTGKSEVIGEIFTGHSAIRKLSFTGSTAVGRKLMAQCAPNLQKLSLELGGNAPFIVFDDADVDKAVAGAMAAKFRNSGQTCVCPNRFLVQTDIYPRFVAALKRAMSELVVGDGRDPGVQQCSLINRAALEKVQQHYDNAVAQGAEVLLGERPGSLPHNRVAPLLLSGITEQMALWQEETFGPLVGIRTFTHEQEGIDLANDTPYGLAAYFYARDIDRIWRIAGALKSGMVGINEGAISNAAAPFGGVDQSGFGREGSLHGLVEYQQLKYLCFGVASES